MKLQQKRDAQGTWDLVFRQTYGTKSPNNTLWPRNQIQLNVGKPESANYSILHTLESYRDRSIQNKFEFKLVWPNTDIADQHWRQYSNPSTSAKVQGYEAVNAPHRVESWGGLQSGHHWALMNGSSLDDSNRWFYALGSYGNWNNGIPGPNKMVNCVELWVCSKRTKLKPKRVRDAHGVWDLVFRQTYGTNSLNNTLWPRDQIQLNVGKPESANYSILHTLENYRDRSIQNKFEFKLVWPNTDIADQHWRQYSNPSKSAKVQGYEAVNAPHSVESWGGLQSGHHCALMNGSSLNDSNHWFYALGSYGNWNNGIPGPNKMVNCVELWVCSRSMKSVRRKDVDISHAIYVHKEQEFNKMFNTLNLYLDDIRYRAEEESKDRECAFLSEDEFANNIIHCRKDINGVDLSDKFIHVQIDHNDPKQIESAASLACTRAFQSRFVYLIAGITKCKAFGEMFILLPSGLTKKHTFNGKRTVYRGTAKFTVSETSTHAFNCDVYYNIDFNPIRRASDSSFYRFSLDDQKENGNEALNALYEDAAQKLQIKYLKKMNRRNKMNKAYHSDTIPGSDVLKIPKTQPKESCRAYFTGKVVGGTYAEGISVAYQIDDYSEYVGQGEYPKNREAFPKAVASTFDGIAIDRNTRVVIYEKENFEGKILLDARGPKIVNNGTWKNDSRYNHCNTDIFPDSELQKNFPIDVRIWTDTNMHQWSYGSVKILSNVKSS